jgi:hypothetical protein
MILTQEEINSDIRAFKKRILDAQSKLEFLPDKTGWLESWEMKKKVEKERQALISEISHVSKILSYATGALLEITERQPGH